MTTAAPVVLYVEASWSSPWVAVVHSALREKAVPFTTATAMVRHGVGAVDALRGRTLTGSSPVLQHGDFWLAESLAILEYLEEMFPTPRMLPFDVQDRARARQLLTWMRNDHADLRRERPSELVFYPHGELAPLGAGAQRAVDDLLRVCDRLGADARGCLLGDQFGAVDVEMAFALMRLVATGTPVPAPVRAYAATVWQRPSVQEFVAHRRPPNSTTK